uniref:Uncharacterized protein n=1 Tax=Romanomermis culicivorax TaxID=13658 RepID=A0A915K4Y5_ROMCU
MQDGEMSFTSSVKPGSYFCSLLGERARRCSAGTASSKLLAEHARRANICSSSRTPRTKNLLAGHARGEKFAREV